jgi:hypothetical protein
VASRTRFGGVVGEAESVTEIPRRTGLALGGGSESFGEGVSAQSTGRGNRGACGTEVADGTEFSSVGRQRHGREVLATCGAVVPGCTLATHSALSMVPTVRARRAGHSSRTPCRTELARRTHASEGSRLGHWSS